MVKANETVLWQLADVTSPNIKGQIPVVVAPELPYFDNSNRFQTLNIYLPTTTDSMALVNTSVIALPGPQRPSDLPSYYVHIHGGACRDPQLTAASI